MKNLKYYTLGSQKPYPNRGPIYDFTNLPQDIIKVRAVSIDDAKRQWAKIKNVENTSYWDKSKLTYWGMDLIIVKISDT